MRTSAIEDYLKAIYKLRADGEAAVTTLALAGRLGVAPPSATAMVKKLAALELVSHAPYHGVELTEAGERIALEVIRHHRIIETYLAQVLGIAWDKVHEEAERLEHVLSEEVEARMAAALGEPAHDPHGAPIPSVDGRIARERWPRLDACESKSLATVRRVSDENAELLRHLYETGLVPGARIEVVRNVAAEGALVLRVDGKKRTVGTGAAAAVFVETDEVTA
ncbi:MAG TPA: metal-dependent transcriptional regulator [Abditibacteriaceae bacterium]|jgi:DtxR family Mn-dependent transcriptional regulator